MTVFDALLALVLGSLAAGAWLVEHVRDDPDDLDRLQQRRVAGDLSQAEFERRLNVLLDDEAQRIKACVRPVPGIGPETARYIAEEFDTVEDLRAADVEDLRDLPGIGEHRATAIQRRLS